MWQKRRFKPTQNVSSMALKNLLSVSWQRVEILGVNAIKNKAWMKKSKHKKRLRRILMSPGPRRSPVELLNTFITHSDFTHVFPNEMSKCSRKYLKFPANSPKITEDFPLITTVAQKVYEESCVRFLEVHHGSHRSPGVYESSCMVPKVPQTFLAIHLDS